MTVKELKNILSSLPDNAEVCTTVEIDGEYVFVKTSRASKQRAKKVRSNSNVYEAGNVEEIVVVR